MAELESQKLKSPKSLTLILDLRYRNPKEVGTNAVVEEISLNSGAFCSQRFLQTISFVKRFL